MSRFRDLISKPLARPVSRLAAATAMVVTFYLVFEFSAYGPFSQTAHMRRAAAHADKIRPLLAADRRFDHVDMGAGTADNGCLFVIGRVRTSEDLAALNAIVAKSSSPVPVKWAVSVAPIEPPDSGAAMQLHPTSATQ